MSPCQENKKKIKDIYAVSRNVKLMKWVTKVKPDGIFHDIHD